MRAYHHDLRERVLATVADGVPITTVAQQYRLHRSTIYRYLAHQAARGTLDPLPRPGRARRIPVAAHPQLLAQLAQDPTATLSAHCARWAQATGTLLRPATMSRASHRLGWTRKKGVWQPANAMPIRGLPGGMRP